MASSDAAATRKHEIIASAPVAEPSPAASAILHAAAAAFQATASATKQYANLIEAGPLSAHDLAQLSLQISQTPLMMPPISITMGDVTKKKGKGNVITFQSFPSGPFPADGDLGDGKKRKRATKEKKPKDPNAPKRPPSAYLLYQNEFRKEIKDQNPTMTYPQVLQEISKMWAALSPEDKKPYLDATDLAKAEFEKAKTEYLEAHPAGGDVALEPTDDASESSGDSPVLPKSTSSVGLLVDQIAKNEEKRKRKEAAAKAKAKAAAAAPPPAPVAPSESLGSDDGGDQEEQDEEEEEEEEEEVKPPPKKRAKKVKTPPTSPGKGKKDKRRK